ncbi:M20 family metallopeptidase [Paeniglutamicibacter sp. MACA_103]|uniref:M20 family metallopeptidase n=1 Tax=Paeniglutamicibacter sp. MACA_103 TaxID=3377337 RepID=UPI003892D8F6
MNKQETLVFLQEIIRFASESGDGKAQAALQELIARRLADEDSSLVITQDTSTELPWTLIRTSSKNGKMLLFACHVDTVPTGDVEAWTYPPFAGVLAEQRVHGRGSVDMKGGISVAAAGLLAASAANANVGLLLTADEEIGCLGAPGAATALRDIEVGATIIPEATNNMVVLGHRGALWLRLETVGLAAHGSTPELGINAALKIGQVMARASDGLPLAKDRFLGRETWNLGVLQSGTAPNIVPERAVATVDMRTVAEGSRLQEWWASQPEINAVSRVLSLPPLQTEQVGWVETLPAAISPHPAAYFTDGAVIARSLPGIPVVIWGPGEPKQMHARDESLDIASLELAYEQFHEVVSRWGS